MTMAKSKQPDALKMALILNGTVNGNTGNSGNYSTSIPISLGYIAQAQAALLLMEENYVKMGQIQNQTDILLLKSQTGQDGQMGTVMAIAKAIETSADADAKNSMLDMGNELLEGAGSLANAGMAVVPNASETTRLNEAQNDLNNATQFKTRFNTAQPAGRVLGDDGAVPQLSDAQQVRLAEIKEGRGSLAYRDGDDVIMQHAKANDQDRAAIAKRLTDAEHDANNRMLNANTERQVRIQKYQAGISALQHGVGSTTINAEKAKNSADVKGPADALRAVAQASDQNISDNARQVLDQAKQAYQDATALNQVRNALGSNNGTAGQ